MVFIPKSKVEPILSKFKPMTEYSDFVSILSLLLERPLNGNAMEIGTGNASWPMSLSMCGVNNYEWVLVEDFSWTLDHLPRSRDWATNFEHLQERLNHECPKLKVSKISDIWQHDDVFDLIRIDCKVNHDEMMSFVKNHVSDNGWILIDDCKMNCGFERIQLAWKLMNADIIYPVWMGTKECLFSKNPNDGDWAISKFDTFQTDFDLIYTRRERNCINGVDRNYVVTSQFQVPGTEKTQHIRKT